MKTQQKRKIYLKKDNSFKLPSINNQKRQIDYTPQKNVIKSMNYIDDLEESMPQNQSETQFEYVNQLIKKIKHLANIFKISTGLALNLLIKCQYEEEAFNVLAFEIQNNKNLINLNKMFDLKFGVINEECPVCLRITKPEDMISLKCLHNFCKSCFQEYLFEIMKSEGKFCFFKTCPMENCTEYLTFEIFEELLENDIVQLKKYRNLVFQQLLGSIPPNKKICPSPNCNFIVTVNKSKQTVICPNNHLFCSKCCMFPHMPLKCEEFSFFINATNLNDAYVNNWICSQTRKCPNCLKDIEKNGGCNHMTCKLCSHQFCWLCLKNWTNHSTEKCRNFQKDVNKTLQERKNEAKEKLKFYAEICKVQHLFEMKRENIIQTKNNIFRNLKYTKVEDDFSREEFQEYIVLISELQTFLFFGENYARIFQIDQSEKKKVMDRFKGITSQIAKLRLRFSKQVNFEKIHQTFHEIKNEKNKYQILNQIKPLMNDVIIMKEKNKHEMNRKFF